MTLNNCLPMHTSGVVEGTEQLAEAFRRLASFVKTMVGVLTPFFLTLWDACKQADIPPKWIHLAAHAKKARVRKKYRALCVRRVAEVIA